MVTPPTPPISPKSDTGVAVPGEARVVKVGRARKYLDYIVLTVIGIAGPLIGLLVVVMN